MSSRHLAEPTRHHASLVSLLVLGAVITAGLSGTLGGTRSQVSESNADVSVTIESPAVSRTGDILQTVVSVVARRDVGQLVIAVDAPLWNDITINSTMPEAEAEEFVDGQYRFTFGPLKPGQPFRWQVAQQINPALFGTVHGRVVVLDGTRPLAQLNFTMRVMP